MEIQRRILSRHSDKLNKLFTVKEIAQFVHLEKDTETMNEVIPHLTAIGKSRIVKAQRHSFLDSKFALN